MRVLEEPVAAAVAYNLHKAGDSAHVLVYDIGGGTLDASLLLMNGKAVSVLATAGDEHLGGSDFDHRIFQILVDKMDSSEKIDGPSSSLSSSVSLPLPVCERHVLRILSEKVKITLSKHLHAEVLCVDNNNVTRKIGVTRDEFDLKSADLIGRLLTPVRTVLNSQGMSADEIDDIVLVGGASRMPQVHEQLKSFFGVHKRLRMDIDPDITVAYGAANVLD